MMKIKKGLIYRDRKFIKNNEWYHQRFDACPQFILVISEAELTREKRKLSWGHSLTHWGYFENDKCDWYIDMRDIKRITGKFIELCKTDSRLSNNIIRKWDKDEKGFYLLREMASGADQ